LKKSYIKIIKTIFFIGLGLFFIFFFWGKLDKEQQQEIIDNFFKANYFWVFLAFVAGVLSHILRSARWNLLIETVDSSPPLITTFNSVMAGYLANLAVPRLGEITRAAMLSKKTKTSFDKIFGTVLAERAFDLLFYILLFFITIFFYWGTIGDYVSKRFLIADKGTSFFSSWTFIIIVSIVILTIIFIWVLRKFKHKKTVVNVRNFFANILKGILSIFRIKKVFLFFVYTIAMWIMYLLMVYLAFFSIPLSLDNCLEVAFLVLVFGTIGIIIIQGGIGIYPIIVSEIMLIFGVDVATGYSIGWIAWLVQTILIIIFGMIAFILVNYKNKDEYSAANSK
jgi:uncharacterized protein (TIRG00374 family)